MSMTEKSPRVPNGVATRVLLENDRVKIWELDLEPGEATDEHEHTMDYILVIIEGDKIAADYVHDNQGGMKGQRFEAPINPPTVVYQDKGGRETAINTGSKRYYEILIELKD